MPGGPVPGPGDVMFLDLEYRTRTDGEFRIELERRRKRLEELDRLSARDSAQVGAFHEALEQYLELCQFNLANLAPYFWPAYPKDRPLFFADYPFAYQMFNLQLGGFSVFRGSRQISKTTSFACRQSMMARMFRGFKSLYIVPRSDQLATYQNRFREIEQASRFHRRDTQLRQNLGYKEFSNGSIIEMVRVQTTAAGIRGKSTDEILYDEYQNFDPDLELEVAQTQAASEFKITTYAGTSLTTDSALEQNWNESSQGSWVIKCGCGHYNIPLPEFGVLDMIQPPGPCCSRCGRRLVVRDGKFVHAKPQLFDAGYRGFHIPQLIVPAVVGNPIRWAEIYRDKNRTGGNRKFMQEILGVATEEGEKGITRSQLVDICILGRDTERLKQNAIQGEYDFVVSGCDWGGSDHIPQLRIKRSTTVHVIIGVRTSGHFDILFFRRHEGMSYDEITADIICQHTAYRGYALASDFGVGAVYNSGLRRQIPAERHLIFNYVGPASDLLSQPQGAHQFNAWSLNKSESISLTFEAVRRKRIRCYDFELAEPHLNDFLNLFRAPGERGQGAGATTFLYRSHPTKPNDALMAVNYAYTLGRILIGEPMVADISSKLLLENTLRAGIPGDHFSGLPGAFSG